MFLGSVSLTSLGSLLEIQNFSSDPRPTASESSGDVHARESLRSTAAVKKFYSKQVGTSLSGTIEKLSAQNRLLKQTLQTSGKPECNSNNEYNGVMLSVVVS